jgi:hypothetical protein
MSVFDIKCLVLFGCKCADIFFRLCKASFDRKVKVY